MKNRKVVKLTESDLTRLVKRVISESKRDYPVRRDVSDYGDFKKYSHNTKWSMGNKDRFDGYVEKFGPFTLYIGADDSVKIGCIGGRCYDQNDNLISNEEAAALLGVDSLGDIQV